MKGLYTGTVGRADDGRPEGPLERADRNMSELLQELRVAQTGVQIMFAFLLTLAFQPRFAEIDALQRGTYVVTLLLSVVTAGLLVAPAAVHRVVFHCGVKVETVRLGHRLLTAGLATMALTISGAVLLVLDVAVGRWFAVAVAAVVLLMLLALWFLLPLPLLRQSQTTPDEGEGPSPAATGSRPSPDRQPSDGGDPSVSSEASPRSG